MFTPRHARRVQRLVTYRAHVIVAPKLLGCCERQRVDLVRRRPSPNEDLPSFLRLHPDVEVGMNTHHHRPDRPSSLKQHDPHAVAKEEDSEEELYRVPRRLDVVDVIVQSLPHSVDVRVDHKEEIQQERYEDFDDDLDAEGTDSEEPRTQVVYSPQVTQEATREDEQNEAGGEHTSVLTFRRVSRGAQVQQERVDHSVYETQHRRHQEARVLVEPVQSLVRRHPRQPRLKCQDEEQYGRHSPHVSRFVIVRFDEHCNHDSKLVSKGRNYTCHTHQRNGGVTATDDCFFQRIDSIVNGEVQRGHHFSVHVFRYLLDGQLDELVAESLRPEDMQHDRNVQPGPV